MYTPMTSPITTSSNLPNNGETLMKNQNTYLRCTRSYVFAIALLVAVAHGVFASKFNGPKSNSGSQPRKTTQGNERQPKRNKQSNLIFGLSFDATNEGCNRNATGRNNTCHGISAGGNNTAGSSNAFFGTSAGFRNTTGMANSFFGAFAGYNNETAGFNSFFGTSAGYTNDIGGNNAFFGAFAAITMREEAIMPSLALKLEKTTSATAIHSSGRLPEKQHRRHKQCLFWISSWHF